MKSIPASAVHDWQKALGLDAVRTDSGTLTHYARSSSNSPTFPSAVLWPNSTNQVREALLIAGRYGIPVYPISRGRNWGYGDACAPTDGQVILDLSRMNRILEFDQELGYVRIEAGVSQGELHRYLVENNLPFWMDATGAGPDASIVGNTLDRGYGHTRYGDRSLHTCGMKVVLPEGEILDTGFGHYAGAKAGHAYRNGIGPLLDGLFFQSNYGVVTEMGLWLMPKPEVFTTFFFGAEEDEALEEIIGRLAPLKLQGLLPSAVHIGNDLRLFANQTRYPFARTDGRFPLPADIRAEMRRELGIGAWTVCGSITGTRETVRALKQRLKRDLKSFHPVFLDDNKLSFLKRTARVLNWAGAGAGLQRQIQKVEPIFDLLKGIPTPLTVKGGSWRVRGEDQEGDPLESHAGLAWVSPVLPMTARAAREVYGLLEGIYTRHGFDTLLTFTMITDRAFCCVSNLSYDRRDQVESARAKNCYAELYQTLVGEGYIPYRSGPSGFEALDNSSTFWNLAAKIKDAIDPQAIISPGRYVPQSPERKKAIRAVR